MIITKPTQTIYCKYDIGDYIFCVRWESSILQLEKVTIEEILIQKDGTIKYCGGRWDYSDNNVFFSLEEAQEYAKKIIDDFYNKSLENLKNPCFKGGGIYEKDEYIADIMPPKI